MSEWYLRIKGVNFSTTVYDTQDLGATQGASLALLGFKADQIDQIVAVTGERDGQPGFTSSDLTQRLIPAIVLDT